MIDTAPPITLLLLAWVKLHTTFPSPLRHWVLDSGSGMHSSDVRQRNEKHPSACVWYFHNSVDISSPDGSYWLPSLFCIPWTAIWNIAQLERNQNSHYFERDFHKLNIFIFTPLYLRPYDGLICYLTFFTWFASNIWLWGLGGQFLLYWAWPRGGGGPPLTLFCLTPGLCREAGPGLWGPL